jgi:4'-phosphopantetheinyl transferase
MTQAAGAPVEVHWFDLREASLLAPDELSPDEHLRAARLTTDVLRRRYTASHVALRRVLSGCLGIAEPRRVSLSWRKGVKPSLDMPSNALTFSLSRSGDMAAIALGEGIDVGIDVETDDRAFGSLDMRDAILTPMEKVAVEGLAEAERASAARRLWVRKEAIVKALGTGFTRPPSSVSAGHPLQASGAQACGPVDVRWADVMCPAGDAAAAIAWCKQVR